MQKKKCGGKKKRFFFFFIWRHQCLSKKSLDGVFRRLLIQSAFHSKLENFKGKQAKPKERKRGRVERRWAEKRRQEIGKFSSLVSEKKIFLLMGWDSIIPWNLKPENFKKKDSRYPGLRDLFQVFLLSLNLFASPLRFSNPWTLI